MVNSLYLLTYPVLTESDEQCCLVSSRIALAPKREGDAGLSFYKPENKNRFFGRGVRYTNIKWSDFGQVVQQFRSRIHEWYLKPGDELQNASWDYSFTLMAIDCLLIDTLSQYWSGNKKSSQALFKR